MELVALVGVVKKITLRAMPLSWRSTWLPAKDAAV
jgi:hypothetical protein